VRFVIKKGDVIARIARVNPTPQFAQSESSRLFVERID
jgi:hypothetical protein